MATAEFGLTNGGKRRILLETEFREKHLITQIPGAKYDVELRKWVAQPTYTTCMQLSNVFGQSLTVSDEIRDFAKSEYGRIAKLVAIRVQEDPDERPVYGGFVLKPKQVTGVDYMSAAGNVVLGDDMGSGKTVQVANLLHETGANTAIIVAPNSTLKRGWVRHINILTEMEPFLVRGGAATRRKIIKKYQEHVEAGGKAALILSWNIIKEHIKLKHYGSVSRSEKEKAEKELDGLEFDYAIADEAHRLKNPGSKWTRAVWNIKASNRLALTGTPIANHPGEYWSILHYVDPTEWPSRAQYVDRYCVTQFNPHGRGTVITGLRFDTRDEFYHLTDRYFIRRMKEEIMGRTIQVHTDARVVNLSPKHMKMYKQFKDELIARVEEGAISATNPLAATSRLVQLSCGMLKQTGYKDPLVEDSVDTYELIEPSPKLDELERILADIPDTEQVIVFSGSKQLIQLAVARFDASGETYCQITGDFGGDDRDEQLRQFQEQEVRVALCTPGAGGEGIDLTTAKYMIFINRNWSMIDNLQAEDRNNRIGQLADDIYLIDIVTEDTIDERVYEVFGEKTRRLDQITRDNLKDLLI